LFVTAVCLLFSYFVIGKIFKEDWSLLLANIILTPLLFVLLSLVFRIGALKQIRSLISGYLKERHSI
jgi:hypothetical protein